MNDCRCGCGTKVSSEWATGHHRRGTTFSLSDEARNKIRQSKIGSLNPRFGQPGTRLGMKHTTESREKIRRARYKQKITYSHRRAISQGLLAAYREGRRRAEDSPFYVDGRHTRRITQEPEYKAWRTAVFERDNYTCVECGIRGGALNADHIRPKSTFPELIYEISNGRTLCRPCHVKTPTWGQRVVAHKNTTNFLKALGETY